MYYTGFMHLMAAPLDSEIVDHRSIPQNFKLEKRKVARQQIFWQSIRNDGIDRRSSKSNPSQEQKSRVLEIVKIRYKKIEYK